jgi:uncharacterized protein (TIGR00661 family)
MKILYAIQSTGNGHLTRALEIVPILKTKGEVDVLLSGTSSELKVPFKVDYQMKGLSFVFGKAGGVDVWNTYMQMNSLQLLRDIKNLPIEKYDLIISDFEPVSAWAAKMAKVPSIGLSNQAATLHPLAPKPKSKDIMGKLVLEHYCPTTFNYGFHFKSLDRQIFTPIIRKQIRDLKPTDSGHYTVYLPAYSDEKIIKNLKRFKNIEWQIFSKNAKEKYGHKDIFVQPLNNDSFIKSMLSSKGVLCNAGFGTTSEALFLGKKLLVVPMKTQYEQQCNAAMLKSMGVPVLKKLKKKHEEKIEDWLSSKTKVVVNYPDQTEKILDVIIAHHAGRKLDKQMEHAPYHLFQ